MTFFDLVILRHGKAVRSAPSDEERPLSEEGVHIFRGAARGLARLLTPPIEVRPSPYLRARQTADILSVALQERALDYSRTAPDPWLTPESPPKNLLEQVFDLVGTRRKGTLVLVTHQPLAGDFLGLLLAGPDSSFPLAPGEASACRISTGGTQLKWKLPAPLAALIGSEP